MERLYTRYEETSTETGWVGSTDYSERPIVGLVQCIDSDRPYQNKHRRKGKEKEREEKRRDEKRRKTKVRTEKLYIDTTKYLHTYKHTYG